MTTFLMENGLSTRRATLDDVDDMLRIDRMSWDDGEAVSRENTISRIKTFPDGIPLVFYGGELAAYCVAQIVRKKLVDPPGLTWDRATDNGSIIKSHDIEGDYIYGISLSANPDYSNSGASVLAVRMIQALCIKYQKQSFVFGSRMPNYRSWYETRIQEGYSSEESGAEIYLHQHLSGEIEDPLLRYFSRLGINPRKVLPNYFSDQASRDYGVLVEYVNPEIPAPGHSEALSQITRGGYDAK